MCLKCPLPLFYLCAYLQIFYQWDKDITPTGIK